MTTALKISTQGGVHTITLSRPDVRNAFNDEVIAELKNAFLAVAHDSAVRCVVLDADAAETAMPQSGVAEASLEDVLQLRYTLEPFIVGLVAQSANSHDIGQLRLTLMDMREALEADDTEAGVKAYIAFHEALFALTTNPIFQSVVQQTSNALKQSAQVLHNSPEHLAARLEENEAVVRAIRNKDSAQASAQMRRHILQEGLRMGIELTIPDEHPGN